MKINLFCFLVIISFPTILLSSCQDRKVKFVTVPFQLDHNRMLIEAEFQKKDGSWRKALLWVDTGNPDFMISEAFARDMGIEVDTALARQEVPPPANVSIGDMTIPFDSVKSSVEIRNQWLFNTMHIDGNFPSTVLKKYHVVFDYPVLQFTIAEPGIIKPRGIKSPASIHSVTGIVQMDAVIDGEKYSFALDNGASFSYVPDSLVVELHQKHPDWPNSFGAVGCANIWGYWPGEENWQMLRIPELQWGNVNLQEVIIAGLPPFFRGKKDVGTWYSQKSAHPVNGFLGPNSFKAFRIEIDYANSAVYLEKGSEFDANDMDLVGLTLRLLNDGKYEIIGVVSRDGKPVIFGIEPGDILLRVDDFKTTGATMGKVIDKLRGKPGDMRNLILERQGKQFAIEAKVEHFL